jgi:cell pole-organizing protein PopZ
MQSPGREPSMEDILASIKKVIAEEKVQRVSASSADAAEDPLPEGETGEAEQVDILELNEPLAPPVDLGPPLLDEGMVGHSRQSFEELQTIAATVPPAPAVNPLEEMVRQMLKPILKQWLDEHLPQMVDEHVKREISRITGRQL